MDLLGLIKALSIIAALLFALYGAFLIVKKRQLQHASIKGHSITVLAYKKIDITCAITLIEIDGTSFVVASNSGAIVIHPFSQSPAKNERFN